MIRIGITGQNGFVGTHLYNAISLLKEEFEIVDFEKGYFDDPDELNQFVSKCDVVVHLAGVNRSENEQEVYDVNICLAEKLIAAFCRAKVTPHVIFSSSSQEEKSNLYGAAKKSCRELFSSWARVNGAVFSGLIIPNVFGPFGKPFYNSVIATFCHQLVNDQAPNIITDGEIKLIYIGELVDEIIRIIRVHEDGEEKIITSTSAYKVSDILEKLKQYKDCYQVNGEIPKFNSVFDRDLFNTYRSFINMQEHFPVKLKQNVDNRGSFVEIIRLGEGGQVSFSTTVPGVTRGNHFHTRKIERFAVIKGKALIQLRKFGAKEVLEFELVGDEPAFVDMPVWYTHNIKNVGEEDLYTIFWINEFFNPADADTYFDIV